MQSTDCNIESGSSTIRIGERLIGPLHPCYVIAELSCNHRQNFEDAVSLVEAAASVGADAVKLQTYTADTLTINSDKPWFLINSEGAPDTWRKENLYSLYEKAFTPWEWHAPLQARAAEFGIDFFSTPFDATAVQFLENLRVPCHKVASYEATYTQLLREVAQTGKPVILSVGFATEEEIELAVSVLRECGSKEIALLHCVTTYAENPDWAVFRLSNIARLQRKFNVVAGFSDNNGGTELPAMAVLAGASIIEKHLTLDKNHDGLDSRFSLDLVEFKDMVSKIRKVESALGKFVSAGSASDEDQFRRYRRSVFVVREVLEGDVFNTDNIRVIRPADGLAPKFYDQVIGRKATQNIEVGTPLSWQMVESNEQS